ncbi:MAG: DUF4236 domain-containing protein [Gallionellaceae bacterium]
MGFFRFRRRIKLFPGLWLNASKTGISTSIGGKGVTVNLRKGKVKTTYSIPGTGLSYIQTTRTHADPPHQAEVTTGEHEEQPRQSGVIPELIVLLLFVLLIYYLLK